VRRDVCKRGALLGQELLWADDCAVGPFVVVHLGGPRSHVRCDDVGGGLLLGRRQPVRAERRAAESRVEDDLGRPRSHVRGDDFGRGVYESSCAWANAQYRAVCVCALRTTCDRCVLCSCLCALCSTRYCWGDVGSGYDRTTVPSGYTWSSISAGVFHTCGVTTAGEGHCWGRNENGMATVPSGYTWATDFAMISPSPPPAPPASPPPPPPPPPALVSVESGGNLHITEGGSLQIGGE